MKCRAMIAAALVLAAVNACASGREEDGPAELFGITDIVVKSGPFDVRVTGGEDGDLCIDSDEALPVRVLHRQEGSRLDVWIQGDGTFQHAPSGPLRVPAAFDVDLVVQASSGTVFVDGVGDGKCSIRTISGAITVSHVRGSLVFDSVSGSISGRGLTLTGDSSFSSVSGNIDVALATPLEELSFDLKSISGRITVGSIRTERGLRMGFGETRVRGNTISGNLSFK
jgi:hypothetical protein